MVTSIQTGFEKVAETYEYFYDMFNKTYKLFDKLNTEYLTAIRENVKEIEKTSEQAKDSAEIAIKAYEEVDSTTEILKETVLKLEDFSDELQKIKHIQNIDELWQHYIDLGDTFNTLEGTVQKIWKFKENALETFEKLDLDITSILDFDNEVEKQIDEIRTSLMHEKEELQNLKNLLDSYAHLGDIDNIYADTEENKAKLKNVEKNIISAKAGIEANKTAIDENRTAIRQNFENLTVCLNEKQEQIENLKINLMRISKQIKRLSKIISLTFNRINRI